MNDPKPTRFHRAFRRTLWARILAPSMPLRMAMYFVLWVALLVVLGLLWDGHGCTGEGVVLR
jgi:hypothetical protein